MHAIIIGAGVAGLSLAASLANRSVRVTLLEQESAPGMYASGRNAAIARSYESDPYLSMMVKESILTMYHRNSPQRELIRQTDLWMEPLEYDYQEDSFLEMHSDALKENFRSQTGSVDLPDGSRWKALRLASGGIMDPGAILQDLQESARQGNFTFMPNTKLAGVTIGDTSITAISTDGSYDSGFRLSGDDVLVLATGSWATSPPAGITALPLVPHKRHLFVLRSPHGPISSDFPIYWKENSEFYVRREGPQLIATHGDQTPVACDDYAADSSAGERFSEAACHAFPFLADFQLVRHWACLRTFPLDGRPVMGYDPHLANLFWHAGFGGRGMSLAYAIGDYSADLWLAGPRLEDETINPFTPHRFF